MRQKADIEPQKNIASAGSSGGATLHTSIKNENTQTHKYFLKKVIEIKIQIQKKTPKYTTRCCVHTNRKEGDAPAIKVLEKSAKSVLPLWTTTWLGAPTGPN